MVAKTEPDPWSRNDHESVPDLGQENHVRPQSRKRHENLAKTNTDSGYEHIMKTVPKLDDENVMKIVLDSGHENNVRPQSRKRQDNHSLELGKN